MIVRNELWQWLSSGPSQEGSAAAAEGLGRSWSDEPAVTELRRRLRARDGTGAAAVVLLAREFFDRVGGLERLIDDLIAASERDPFFRPPFRLLSSEFHSGLLVFEDPKVTISLGLVRLEGLAGRKVSASGPRSIVFNGQQTLVRLIRAGGALLSFWEAPPIGDDFAADAAGQCRLVGRRRMADGETIVLDGRSQSFVIENATSEMILLQADIPMGAAPLMVEYDSKTHRLAGASSADGGGSRLEMMVSLLRLMDAREAIPVLLETIPESHFSTRWHVMRELLAWDAEAALPNLSAMALEDSHPDVRAAARSTLELFFEQEPCLA